MARKTHTKSRHGCFNCKQKRVKCDERKPHCQKCVARDIVCTYPSSRPLIWVADNSLTVDNNKEGQQDSKDASPPSSSPNLQEEEAPEPKNLSLNLDNADLIIHWITKTVYTVNPTSNIAAIEICQTVILDQARKHHFLLHGLLALSALHYAEVCSASRKYTDIAIAHYTHGLSLYHSILSNINRTNDAASIAFSSITTMFTFALSRPDPAKGVGPELVDDLAQILLLSMGWFKVVGVIEGLDSRPASDLLASEPINNIALSADTEAAFARLQALDQGANARTYTQTISSLKAVFRDLEKGGNDNPHTALEWAKSMPEDFVRLVRGRDSLALVILGFYCVILDKIPQVWWIEGWSRSLFSVIWQESDLLYREVLEWPRESIKYEI